MNRARVRAALLDSIRVWHETGDWPGLPELFAEERAVITQAIRWYGQLFPEPVREVTLPAEEPTLLIRRQVLLGGWVDLGIVHDDGTRELRQLSVAGRGGPSDPLQLPAVKLAVLRLATVGWCTAGRLRVTWADLLRGQRLDGTVELPGGLGELGSWLDEHLDAARGRADADRVEPGADCATCRYVPRCPAHDVAGSMTGSRSALVPGVLSLSPTSVEAWRRCSREWRDRSLLGVAASNVDGGSDHGLYLHQLLYYVHRHGSCHDAEHVREVLAAHAADERTAAEISRHADRCPIGAESAGHEVEWARAYRGPPVFLATARLDAAWVHDGLLDVRDYKTGRVTTDALSNDPRARVQAWVATPHAAALGLRLRLRYEHLATEVVDDPEPWEPTDDELSAIGEELAGVVTAMRAERDFAGVADEAVCQRCAYRAVCDESASPARPTWPQPGTIA